MTVVTASSSARITAGQDYGQEPKKFGRWKGAVKTPTWSLDNNHLCVE